MPNYRVLVSGEGVRICWEGRDRCCGFRVYCHVWATDPAVAANMAAQMVRTAPELLVAIEGPLPKGAPVFIEAIDETPPGDRQEALSTFHFYPLEGDDWHPLSAVER